MKQSLFLTLFLTILTLAGHLSAQRPQSPVIVPQASVCSLVSQPLDNLYIRAAANGSYVKLPYGSYARGPKIPLAPDQKQMSFYQQQIDAKGVTTYIEVYVVSIAEMLEPMIVFAYDSMGKILIGVLDDSVQAHPGGHVRFLNKLSVPIAVKMADKPVIVESGKDTIFKPESLKQGKFNSYSFEYALVEGGKPWVSPEMTFRLKRENQRLLVLVTHLEFNDTDEGDSPDAAPVVKNIVYSPRAYMMSDIAKPAVLP